MNKMQDKIFTLIYLLESDTAATLKKHAQTIPA